MLHVSGYRQGGLKVVEFRVVEVPQPHLLRRQVELRGDILGFPGVHGVGGVHEFLVPGGEPGADGHIRRGGSGVLEAEFDGNGGGAGCEIRVAVNVLKDEADRVVADQLHTPADAAPRPPGAALVGVVRADGDLIGLPEDQVVRHVELERGVAADVGADAHAVQENLRLVINRAKMKPHRFPLQGRIRREGPPIPTHTDVGRKLGRGVPVARDGHINPRLRRIRDIGGEAPDAVERLTRLARNRLSRRCPPGRAENQNGNEVAEWCPQRGSPGLAGRAIHAGRRRLSCRKGRDEIEGMRVLEVMMMDQLMENAAKRPGCVTIAAESRTGIDSTGVPSAGKSRMLSLPFWTDSLKVRTRSVPAIRVNPAWAAAGGNGRGLGPRRFWRARRLSPTGTPWAGSAPVPAPQGGA